MRFTRILLLVSLLALVVTPIALALRFTDDSYNWAVGETGKPYTKQLAGAGGCGPALPYQYRVLPGSALPPGLTMNSSGLVTGTPTTAGNYSFWIELSDQDPPSQSWCRTPVGKAERQFTMTVIQGLSILQKQAQLAGQLGIPYTLQFTATGGNPTWAVSSGALPAGLSLSSTGLLSGTPTVGGDFHFQVKAVDGGRSDVQTYTLSVVPQLKITSPAKAAAEVGRDFQFSLTGEGGRTTYSWSATGLPTGLNLDAATGAISGVPTEAGVSDVKVTLTDKLGLTSTIDLKLAVNAPLAIVKRSLPAAKVGRSYSAHLHVLGGVAPERWTIARGSLPAGIHLNARTGALTGTPSAAGKSHVTISVSDKLGAASRTTFVLKVVG